VGTASRLKEESEAYKSRIVAQAQGDSQRFRSVLAEYQKAPQVTRDRMYLDAMQQIYGNVTKVLVDSRQGLQSSVSPAGQDHPAGCSRRRAEPLLWPRLAAPATTGTPAPAPAADSRTRDSARTRDREAR
jgi:membrane protease subunit HflK